MVQTPIACPGFHPLLTSKIMDIRLLSLFLLFSFFLCLEARAQEKPLFIHSMVGYSLDQDEIKRFHVSYLLDFFWNKYSVIRFYEHPSEDSLIIESIHRETQEIQHRQRVAAVKLRFMQRRITKLKAPLIEDLERLRNIVEEGDSVFIGVKTSYGYVGKGWVDRMDDLSLHLTQGVDIEYGEILKLKVSDEEFNAFKKEAIINENHLRVFLSNNAQNLEKGSLVYKNNMVTANSLEYGLSNNISLSAGIELASLFSGIFTGTESDNLFTPTQRPPFEFYSYADIKAGAQVNDEMRIAGGIMALGGIGEDPRYPMIPFVYVAQTYGKENFNLSFSLYLPLTYSNSYSFERKIPGTIAMEKVDRSVDFPPLSFSALFKIRRNALFMTEHIYYGLSRNEDISDTFGLISSTEESSQNLISSAGIRLIAKDRRINWDLGFIFWGRQILTETESRKDLSYRGLFLPYVSLSYRIR